MLIEDNIQNCISLPSESLFKNTYYDRSDLRKRREILRETVAFIKPRYRELHYQAEQNLTKWSNESKQNTMELNSKIEIGVYSGDWGAVTKDLTELYGKRFAVLNMANAHVPGGGYFEGLIAQEENMFRRTDCHFSIERKHLENDRYYKKEWIDLINGINGKVYLDKKNPRICVRGPEIRDKENLGYEWFSNDSIFPFYEMRSAAVDLRSGMTFSYEESMKRIRAQFSTLIEANIKHVVFGAHGCGAFLNPAEKVADIYSKVIEEFKENFLNISFAIYSAGYGPDNYAIFSKILKYH